MCEDILDYRLWTTRALHVYDKGMKESVYVHQRVSVNSVSFTKDMQV